MTTTMLAAVYHGQHDIRFEQRPVPEPDSGELLIEVGTVGVCGTDAHEWAHGPHLHPVDVRHPATGWMGPITPGHEFSGVVAELGRKVSKEFKVGTRVVSLPMVRMAGGPQMTGLSPLAPGGYAEQVLVEGALTFAVPNGLSMDIAALTEPMAVALHAVRRSEIRKRDTAIVVGCGPVGLGVICQLKALGVETIVASDFSPGRRALAARCGADVVVDPAVDSPYEKAAGKGTVTEFSGLAELGIGSMEKLRKLPGWSHIYRALDALGAAGPKRPIIFECVGVPGIIDAIAAAAPLSSRVIVVGVCMGADQLRPAVALGKEIDLRFVFCYTPLEFRDTLHMLADGKVDASALITGKVGLDGVANAFQALGDPERHAKILIDPRSSATAP